MAARSAWKGSLSFGLVNVPIKLMKATEDRDIHFNWIHDTDNGKIKQKRFCETCREEVDMSGIVKGFAVDSETVVRFTEEDLDNLPVGTIDTVKLCRLDVMPDPLALDSSYFVMPEKSGEHALAVLFGSMKKSAKKAIFGNITIRHKERPCAIWVRENGLVLSTLRFSDEIREHQYESSGASKEEIQMAGEILAEMRDEMIQVDHYRESVLEVAAKKAGGQLTSVPKKNMKSAPPTDLMAALLASVEQARKAKK